MTAAFPKASPPPRVDAAAPTVAESGMHRVGALVHYPDILTSLGVDPADVLASAGVAASALASPNNSIPFASFGRLLQAGAERSGLDYLAAMAGRRASLELLGPVGRLMRNAPTLGDAIADLVRNQHRYIRGAAVYSMISGNRLILGYAVHQLATPGIELIWDAVAAAGVTYLTELGVEPAQIEVMLPRRRPERRDVWHLILGPDIRFDRQHVGVAVHISRLHQPVPGADPRIHQEMTELLQSYSIAQWPDLSGRLAREIRVRLMTGQDVSRPTLATWIGLGERTINRRLGAEGTSFQRILAETRCEMARQLLRGSRLEIAEIARALGYSDASAFARAFQGWTGLTASEWRKPCNDHS